MKIAVLGGGMGGLVAAWELAKSGQHDITVYQRGWRLGGKGASGRNASQRQTIEEHGLHVLMGFYTDTFPLLRDTYELVRTAGSKSSDGGAPLPWNDAFTPVDVCTFAQLVDDRWDFFSVRFPTDERTPWDDPEALNFVELLRVGLARLASLLRRASEGHSDESLESAIRHLESASEGEAPLDASTSEAIRHALARIADHSVGRRGVAGRRAPWTRMMAYFVGGNLKGMIDAGLARPDPRFDVIDGEDYRRDFLRKALSFLEKIGVPSNETWNSPFVGGLYDLGFSRSTTLAAGVTLSVVLRLAFGYRGHVAWKMNAGMGDVVFGPLYLALRERNVRFEFFHRVCSLDADPHTGLVERIHLERQVVAPKGYDPLVNVRGVACWPNEPKTALLQAKYQDDYAKNGNQPPCDFEKVDASPYGSPRELVRGTHFDVVVLAISLGGLTDSCASLVRASTALTNAVDNVRTIRTIGLQAWLSATPNELKSPLADSGLLISHEPPLSSWADMTQVARHEEWGYRLRNISYFCDALPDGVVNDAGAAAHVAAEVRRWLSAAGGIGSLFPAFDASKHLLHHYARVNLDRSDRYVLCEKGTTVHRPPADGSGFSNLALAGDWIHTSLNSGCLEAATQGGQSAAEAVLTGRIHR